MDAENQGIKEKSNCYNEKSWKQKYLWVCSGKPDKCDVPTYLTLSPEKHNTKHLSNRSQM